LDYRLALVTAGVVFFVCVLRLGAFFEVDLAGVLTLVLAAVALLTVLAGAFAAVLVAFAVVRAGALLESEALRLDDFAAGAIASIRGCVFFAGFVARTCLTALVCCSSVIRNSWCPSRLATK
jgi:hypothetical protein